MSGNGETRPRPTEYRVNYVCGSCAQVVSLDVRLGPGAKYIQLPFLCCALCENLPPLQAQQPFPHEAPRIVRPTIAAVPS